MHYIDKSLTRLQIWNVSGDKRFEFLREYYYKGASAMIIVYEKGNQESLKLAKKYYSDFKKLSQSKPEFSDKYFKAEFNLLAGSSLFQQNKLIESLP